MFIMLLPFIVLPLKMILESVNVQSGKFLRLNLKLFRNFLKQIAVKMDLGVQENDS